MLTCPKGSQHEYALCFKFQTSNNEVEYEALIVGLRLAKSMGIRHLRVLSDSKVIVNQVNQKYKAKDDRMASYLQKIRSLLNSSKICTVKQVPHSKNAVADALARLALSYEMDLLQTVIVEILRDPSLTKPDSMDIDLSNAVDWRTPIFKYLETRELHEDQVEARCLRRRAAHYLLKDKTSYKRGYSLPLLRCMGPVEARYVLNEVNEDGCRDHLVG